MFLTKEKGYGRNGNAYELWGKRPQRRSRLGKVWWECDIDSHFIDEFCGSQFGSWTGVYLKPGEIRKVESIVFKFAGADG